MIFEQPYALVDERDVLSLAADVIAPARRLESCRWNFTRDGILKRSLRESESHWRSLRLLERELRFAPRTAFHDLLREAVRAGLNYINGVGVSECPMAYVVLVERELWEATA